MTSKFPSFDLEELARGGGGEYVLGLNDLRTHACYMIYGILQAGEGERLVKPGEGHEEILCAVGGPLAIHGSHCREILEQGHAIHVKEDESFFISNPTDQPVVYIMAGGHSRPHY